MDPSPSQADARQFKDLNLDSDVLHIRPGIHLYERLDNERTLIGGVQLQACLLLGPFQQHPVFVAIDAVDDYNRQTIYYAQMLLCFRATYLSEYQHLCYVRYLHTARAVAQDLGRRRTPEETRGPLEAFRWALYPGGWGHPARHGPWYGLISTRQVMYRVHMVRSMTDAGLFRLNTDVWLPNL